jgi:hypothetical protein
VTVTMREVDGEPPSNRKVRTIMNNQFGVFEFGALEPGKRYGLQVRAKRVPDPFFGMIDIHNIHTDTLVFSPGERRQYDVRLTRFTPC